MNDAQRNNRFLVIQLFGYFIGGLIPLFAFLAVKYFKEGTSNPAVSFFALYALFLSLWQSVTILLYFNNKDKLPFLIVYNLQTLFTFVFLHLCILYSGGVSSTFGFEYMYILSIVVGLYGVFHLNTIGGLILISVSYYLNKYLSIEQINYLSSYLHYISDGNPSHAPISMHNAGWMDNFLFGLQVAVAILINGTKRRYLNR